MMTQQARRWRLVGVTVVVVAIASVCASQSFGEEDFVCDDSFQDITIQGDVIVPLDVECDLRDSVVFGTIQIVQGGVSPLRFATLILRNTEVHGDIKHNAADTVDINDESVIHGSVVNLFNDNPMSIGGFSSVDDSTIHGDLITVRTERVEIDAAMIGGNVRIENSDDRISIEGSSIDKTVELNNSVDVDVTGTIIGGNLLCANNDSVDVSGNSVEGVVNCGEPFDVFDLLILIGNWGPCDNGQPGCPGDVTGSGEVDVFDLLFLIANWG